MSSFNLDSIDKIVKRANEPAWLSDLRKEAYRRHVELPWPHPSDDVWRRTDVRLLDPARGFAPGAGARRETIKLDPAQVRWLTEPLGGERLMVRGNGQWMAWQIDEAVRVESFSAAAASREEALHRIIGGNGMTPAEAKLASFNEAFHEDGLYVEVPEGFSDKTPWRIVNLWQTPAGTATCPLTVIRVGAGSEIVLIDEYVGLEPKGMDGPHLVNARIELVLEPGARVHYVRLQRWGAATREFLMQRATLARDASLTMANLNLGAALSKAHITTRLTGENARSNLFGFVFGKGSQHMDQHTLQEHQAPHTFSDLKFSAALKDQSHMVYTGLIRIDEKSQLAEAFQENRNLLLSQTARAETIPMLEILADDVQCKHAAATGPIDEDQKFYLRSRGIPEDLAERILVMGFIEPLIRQVPFEPLQEQLRREIEDELHA